ncbi:hypothetical protein [Bradyrhizobium cenepequi]|uniref:hypothetical protein n=1 Tax=Bradyrhizobium cenepequi TaxID=2821403 RepID=UPI001CE2A59E|nr:hypothetical protein [Bradyrhizobium cenepequi]MCA6107953.1 hypothetical protein [Bradyrhizobium cenepequi]
MSSDPSQPLPGGVLVAVGAEIETGAKHRDGNLGPAGSPEEAVLETIVPPCSQTAVFVLNPTGVVRLSENRTRTSGCLRAKRRRFAQLSRQPVERNLLASIKKPVNSQLGQCWIIGVAKWKVVDDADVKSLKFDGTWCETSVQVADAQVETGQLSADQLRAVTKVRELETATGRYKAENWRAVLCL